MENLDEFRVQGLMDDFYLCLYGLFPIVVYSFYLSFKAPFTWRWISRPCEFPLKIQPPVNADGYEFSNGPNPLPGPVGRAKSLAEDYQRCLWKRVAPFRGSGFFAGF